MQQERYKDDVFENVKISRKIEFAKGKTRISTKKFHLDFYEPEGDELEQRPLIIYAFGGAFLIGWRTQPPIGLLAEKWAKKGFVVASIDYRKGYNIFSNKSAARAVYRAIQDMNAALRYLVFHASKYRIDTKNIFLAGSSSGSITALHAAYMFPEDLQQELFFKYKDLGSLYTYGNHFLKGEFIPVKAVVNLWGAMFDLSFFDAKTKDVLPALVSFHGKHDFVVHHEHRRPLMNPFFMKFFGSSKIHEILEKKGVKNENYFLDEKLLHEPSLFTSRSRDFIVKKSALFLYELMQNKQNTKL